MQTARRPYNSNNPPPPKATGPKPDDGKSLFDFQVLNIKGEPVNLADFKGKIVMVADVASNTIMADIMYEEFEDLTEELGDDGFEVIAFPCNQFKNREGDPMEPGTAEEIIDFALSRAPRVHLMEKVDVMGETAHPLFTWLTDRTENFWKGCEKIDWVFERFLFDIDGKVIKRYKSTASPDKVKRDIVRELKKMNA